jgi:hypothetical protein
MKNDALFSGRIKALIDVNDTVQILDLSFFSAAAPIALY